MNNIHCRWGLERDIPAVLAIERASFEYAWTGADFLQCQRQRNCIAMLAECGDTIVGYMVYELHDRRIDLLNFAVDPERRRTGVGAALVSKLKYKLVSHRRESLAAVVRESNDGALLFFRAQGFRAAGVLRGYYADSGEDGYAIEYRPTPEECERAGGAPVNRIGTYQEW